MREHLALVITILVSLVSGGLSGACVNVIYNRQLRRRQLRTVFYPTVSDLYAAYSIRMQKLGGEHLLLTPGKLPASEDEGFVRLRSSFICDLVQFNELDEARLLRTKMWDNSSKTAGDEGSTAKVDLAPEFEALRICLGKLHDKLQLET